jgi:hypothetical protein
VRVDGLPVRRFPFDQAAEAYRWLDANPNEAVKVALTYDGSKGLSKKIRPDRGGRGPSRAPHESRREYERISEGSSGDPATRPRPPRAWRGSWRARYPAAGGEQ